MNVQESKGFDNSVNNHSAYHTDSQEEGNYQALEVSRLSSPLYLPQNWSDPHLRSYVHFLPIPNLQHPHQPPLVQQTEQGQQLIFAISYLNQLEMSPNTMKSQETKDLLNLMYGLLLMHAVPPTPTTIQVRISTQRQLNQSPIIAGFYIKQVDDPQEYFLKVRREQVSLLMEFANCLNKFDHSSLSEQHVKLFSAFGFIIEDVLQNKQSYLDQLSEVVSHPDFNKSFQPLDLSPSFQKSLQRRLECVAVKEQPMTRFSLGPISQMKAASRRSLKPSHGTRFTHLEPGLVSEASLVITLPALTLGKPSKAIQRPFPLTNSQLMQPLFLSQYVSIVAPEDRNFSYLVSCVHRLPIDSLSHVIHKRIQTVLIFNITPGNLTVTSYEKNLAFSLLTRLINNCCMESVDKKMLNFAENCLAKALKCFRESENVYELEKLLLKMCALYAKEPALISYLAFLPGKFQGIVSRETLLKMNDIAENHITEAIQILSNIDQSNACEEALSNTYKNLPVYALINPKMTRELVSLIVHRFSRVSPDLSAMYLRVASTQQNLYSSKSELAQLRSLIVAHFRNLPLFPHHSYKVYLDLAQKLKNISSNSDPAHWKDVIQVSRIFLFISSSRSYVGLNNVTAVPIFNFYKDLHKQCMIFANELSKDLVIGIVNFFQNAIEMAIIKRAFVKIIKEQHSKNMQNKNLHACFEEMIKNKSDEGIFRILQSNKWGGLKISNSSNFFKFSKKLLGSCLPVLKSLTEEDLQNEDLKFEDSAKLFIQFLYVLKSTCTNQELVQSYFLEFINIFENELLNKTLYKALRAQLKKMFPEFELLLNLGIDVSTSISKPSNRREKLQNRHTQNRTKKLEERIFSDMPIKAEQ